MIKNIFFHDKKYLVTIYDITLNYTKHRLTQQIRQCFIL